MSKCPPPHMPCENCVTTIDTPISNPERKSCKIKSLWTHLSNRELAEVCSIKKEGCWKRCLCVLLRCRVAWTPVPAELSQWFCRTDYQLSRHRKPSPKLSVMRHWQTMSTPLFFFIFLAAAVKTAKPTQAECRAAFHFAKPTRNHTTPKLI